MPVKVFNLRGVPDDEADELRRLLEEHDIDWYETPAGNWGISSPGLWVKDAGQREKVKQLIADYQEARFNRVTGEYEQQAREGRNPTFLDQIIANPLQVIVYLALIAIVLYFSIMPFVDLGR